ncbi:hypothetical protein Cst_c04090 [Thermoclostridium stercorarium subsp. stercorarium DSM 8532]|uniref:Uncharacterized protein n=1 Tax=Thermoclostridium stercorarium (strain ATCC 35414 / DSM 8532 / NCIMB 11754) TaxID=1121335 RepID=L7VLP5_THES1|nr:hypothetical protein Cst_c04090 [Thermoclostridium stercorarium subsp. stercorarium DSM 8532]
MFSFSYSCKVIIAACTEIRAISRANEDSDGYILLIRSRTFFSRVLAAFSFNIVYTSLQGNIIITLRYPVQISFFYFASLVFRALTAKTSPDTTGLKSEDERRDEYYDKRTINGNGIIRGTS